MAHTPDPVFDIRLAPKARRVLLGLEVKRSKNGSRNDLCRELSMSFEAFEPMRRQVEAVGAALDRLLA